MKTRYDYTPDLFEEARKRDAALDLLEESRPRLIQKAREIALELVTIHGTVTGVRVMKELKARGFYDGSKDPRFMGAVFRKGNGWARVGYSAEGSHRCPVSVWELKK